MISTAKQQRNGNHAFTDHPEHALRHRRIDLAAGGDGVDHDRARVRRCHEEDNDKDDADELSNISNDLSERESEILGLMIRGKSPKEICELLNLHKSSVATYRTRIFDKIGVKSNFELYQWALKEGLIHP